MWRPPTRPWLVAPRGRYEPNSVASVVLASLLILRADDRDPSPPVPRRRRLAQRGDRVADRAGRLIDRP